MGSNVKKDELARAHNKSIKSAVSTFYKKAVAKAAEVTATADDVFAAIRQYESVAMRAARKNIIGQKSTSRKVSRLVVKTKIRFGQVVAA
jgi:ribosomal protein S20